MATVCTRQVSPVANRSSDGNLLWSISWNRPYNPGYNDRYVDGLYSLIVEYIGGGHD